MAPLAATLLTCGMSSASMAEETTTAPAKTQAAVPPAATAAPASGTQAAAPRHPSDPAVEPRGYTYKPEGRRDPFVSLLRRGADASSASSSARAPGLAGLSAGEVSLRGTLRARDGFVGMVEGVDKKTYLVRAGDQLRDGTVRSVAADSLVIVTRGTDPLTLGKDHVVRKVLPQMEEAK